MIWMLCDIKINVKCSHIQRILKGFAKKKMRCRPSQNIMLSTYLYLVNSAKMFAKHGWPTETEDTVNQNQTTDYKSPFSGVWPEKRYDTLSKKFLQDIFILVCSPKLKNCSRVQSKNNKLSATLNLLSGLFFFSDQTYYFFGKSWGLFMVF